MSELWIGFLESSFVIPVKILLILMLVIYHWRNPYGILVNKMDRNNPKLTVLTRVDIIVKSIFTVGTKYEKTALQVYSKKPRGGPLRSTIS